MCKEIEGQMNAHRHEGAGRRVARVAILLAGSALAVAACGGGASTALNRDSAVVQNPAAQAPQSAAGQSGAGAQSQSAAQPGQPQAPAAPQTQAKPGTAAAGGAGAAAPIAAASGSRPGGSLPPPPGAPRIGTAPGENFASDVGVTKDTINLGNISMQSATRSQGPAIAGATLKSSDALVDYINKNGGVAGRKLNLVYCDDGGDVTRARACYEKLKTQVFAFVPSETWLTETLHQQLAQDKVPMLTWGWFISEYQDPYMFPCHANGAREALMVSKWLIDNRHPKTAAVMYLNDPEDITATDQATKYFEANGIKVVAKVAQEWDSPDESQHVLSVRVANPDVVMVFTWPTPLAKFLHDAAGQNWAPPMGYWAKHAMADPGYGAIWGDYARDKLASLDSFEVAGAENQDQAGTDKHWGLLQWRMLTDKYAGHDVAGFHLKYTMGHHITQAALSCINAAASAFQAIGANLTRPAFINFLESHSFDTGMGPTLRWPHGDHGQEPYSFNREQMYIYTSAPDGSYDVKRLWPDPIMLPGGPSSRGLTPPYCQCT